MIPNCIVIILLQYYDIDSLMWHIKCCRVGEYVYAYSWTITLFYPSLQDMSRDTFCCLTHEVTIELYIIFCFNVSVVCVVLFGLQERFPFSCLITKISPVTTAFWFQRFLQKTIETFSCYH